MIAFSGTAKKPLAQARSPVKVAGPFLSSMTLASLLSPDRVISEMQAVEHWPAIVELVDHLVAGGHLPDHARDSVLESLKNRETQRSTGIGSGIAIPHAFSDKVEDVVAIFGRSSQGIEFCALDSAPVNFVVLFIVPQEQYALHLRTLAAIAKILNSGEVRRLLADAGDTEDILSVLSKRPTRV